MPPPSREAAAPARVAPVPLARLAHLYLCEGLSTYRIGQLTGLDRQRVTPAIPAAGRHSCAGGAPA